MVVLSFFFFQAEDGIRYATVTGVQTCALPISLIAAVIAVLAVPLPYNALARGRWTALIAYAAMPWFLLLLARMTGIGPFGSGEGRQRRKRGDGERREQRALTGNNGPAWRAYVLLGVPLAAVSA